MRARKGSTANGVCFVTRASAFGVVLWLITTACSSNPGTNEASGTGGNTTVNTQTTLGGGSSQGGAGGFVAAGSSAVAQSSSGGAAGVLGGTSSTDTAGGASMGGALAVGGIAATGGALNLVGGNSAQIGGASSNSVGGTSTMSTGGTPAIAGATATTAAIATGGIAGVAGTTATGGTTSAGEYTAAGGTATGATSSGGISATAGCPGTGGPTMVALPSGYCIDSTEVTRAQYQAWLNTNPSISTQISACSGNTSFTPSQASGWPPTTVTQNYPVNVNWCDAYAYCIGVGKRLCGKIGGGTNAYANYVSTALSQWYAACTSNGTYSSTGYPYGNTYQDSYCNSSSGAAVAVGTMTQCQSTISGYTGIYDMSGNVWEWEDSCNGTTGSSDHCRLRGGAFNDGSISGGIGLSCGYDNWLTRGYATATDVGFRCCSS